MVWHDCKSNPPKKDGEYLLCYILCDSLFWDRAWYFMFKDEWEDEDHCGLYNGYCIPYKWAEVDLSEVE